MRSRVRIALIFLAAFVGAAFLHETGHAIFGFAEGIPVVPTPAKEYVLRPEVEWRQEVWIALGGVVATATITAGTILWYRHQLRPEADAVLAGVLASPGAYTLRYLIVGRGHDGLEWQEAQSALGINPSGHFIDVMFLVLFAAGCCVFVLQRRHSLRWRSALSVAGVALVSLVLMVIVQVGNNLIFDRWFPRTHTVNVPSGIDTR
jgi:nitrate reductase gamma subunit